MTRVKPGAPTPRVAVRLSRRLAESPSAAAPFGVAAGSSAPPPRRLPPPTPSAHVDIIHAVQYRWWQEYFEQQSI